MRITYSSRTRSRLQWLLMLGIIFASSMYVFEMFPGMVKLSLLLVFSLLLFLLSGCRIKKKDFYFLTVILMLIFLSLLYNGMVFSLDIGAVVGVAVAFFIASALSRREFMEKYNAIFTFLAICSLIGYALFIIAPSLVNRFPIHTWRNGRARFANMILSVVPVSMSDYYRNFGIFYEPGIYQIYLNFALLFELFFLKANPKRIVLWVVTLITTLSTNGIISGGMILFAYGIKLAGNARTKRERNRIIIISVVSLAALLLFVYLYQIGIIDNRLFNKFSTTRNSGSTYDRLNAITYAVNKFGENPLLGVGHINLTDAYNITNTPLNLFMLYGLLFGCLVNFAYCMFVVSLPESWLVRAILVVATLSAIISQNMAREWMIWCIVFYGFKTTRLIKRSRRTHQRSLVSRWGAGA